MEEKNYELKLNHFWIDNIAFKANKAFSWPKGGVSMKPLFERNIVKIDDNNVLVSIIFDVSGEQNNPFSLHLDVNGTFELLNWDEDDISRSLITDNAAAILFPYLRQAVSEITTLSGMPPYVIPVANVATLFGKTK